MRSRPKLRARVARAGFIALALLAQPVHEAQAIALRTVVERDAPAPGGGAFVGFASPAINDASQIAFSGTVTNPGPSGVWRETSGVFDLMFALGAMPAVPGGQTIDFVDSVLLDAAGDVVARAGLSSFVEGYYFANGAVVQAIAVEGGAAPGTTGTFDDIEEALRVSDGGAIAFYAQLAMGGGIDVNNFTGIWSGPAGALALAAQQGSVAPGSGGATWFILQGGPGRGQPRLASDGTLAFAATTIDPPSAVPSGVWRGTPGSLAPIVLANDVQYDYAAIASGNKVAFRKAPLISGPLAVRAGTPGSLRTVIQAGDPAPGAPGETIDLGTTLNVPSIRVNASGRVALHALATDGATTREGLWSDASGTLEAVALAGEPAPGTTALVFVEFEGFDLNDLGQTAFVARVGTDVDSLGDPALYLVEPGTAPDLVVLPFADLRVGPGDVRTVSFFDVNLMRTVSRGSAGGGLNHGGELVFAASFFDGTAGLYVATAPEPAGGLGSAVALAAIAGTRRRRRSRELPRTELTAGAPSTSRSRQKASTENYGSCSGSAATACQTATLPDLTLICETPRMKEQPLGGGTSNTDAVVRIGRTVRRPAGEQSATVQDLLSHVRHAGFAGVPNPLGFDSQGREVLEFIPGDVAVRPIPAWATTPDAVASVGVLLRGFREAAASFKPAASARWAHKPPAEYATGSCGHNDATPGNVVFREGNAVSLIDFDWAAPSNPVWDLATAAQHWGPVGDPADFGGAFRGQDPVARVRALVRGFGATLDEKDGLAAALANSLSWAEEFVSTQAANGHPGFAAMWCSEFRARHARARRWLRTNAARLRQAID